MRELEPCPFCGAEVDEDEYEHEPGCYFFIVDSEGSSIDDIHNAWNRRAAPAIEAASVECEPVAEVLWYEPILHEPQTKQGHKIIDASMAWMDRAPLGTKLYERPPHGIDTETRAMVLELCDAACEHVKVWTYPYGTRTLELAKQIREQLEKRC